MPITRVSDPVYEYVCDFDGTTAKAPELPDGWCVTDGGAVVVCPACAAKTTMTDTQAKVQELAAAAEQLVGDAVPAEPPLPEVASPA